MYEVLPRGASPRCAPPTKRRSEQPARKAGPRIGGQDRPAPQHRRTRQTRAAASADKAGPRRGIGGQGRPAPQHRRTRQARAAKRRSCPGSATCVLYLTFYTLSSPFFWFYSPRFARPSPSLYGFPLPFCGFFRLVFPSPLCRAAARAHKRGGRAKRARRNGARTAFQSKPGKNRGGAERAAQSGTRQRGKNAAARRSDAVSPPLLPQSAGAQTRRAGAYT